MAVFIVIVGIGIAYWLLSALADYSMDKTHKQWIKDHIKKYDS